MADALSLLFTLDADGRPAVAEFQRVKKAFASEIAALRKSVAQSFTLPPIKLPTVQTGTRGTGQADAHVREFRRIEAEAAKSARAQEREQKRLNSAVQSLQRQRSAAIIAGFRAEERAAVASSRAQERAARQASQAIASAFRGIGPGLQSLGRTLTVGITAPLAALGAISLKSAKDLDANVNTLKAFTGSAEAAERRLAQLIKTARGTPGLTTNLALTLDAQLRVAQTTQETIDRVLPAIGRLNAVSKLPDTARFTQNLLQLVTQNFERQDLKELVGQSPIAGQLLTEIFNVDSPTNAVAIRAAAQKMGLTTVDAFFTAFADAAQRNQGLATVTESIGTRFEKVVDRVTVALRPLGLAIINAIEPFVEPVARLVERLGAAFASLSKPVQTAMIVFGALAAAAGPILFALGSIATGVTFVVSAISAIAGAVASIGLPVIALAIAGIVVTIGQWVAILGALGLAWKTNFLNIRGLVADAASAVGDAFNRIKAVLEEVYLRILPTLQSVTEKVLATVTALWQRFGPTVVSIVGIAFATVTRIIETTLRFLGNLADLALKIIDGDWRGAWRAFSRIVINALDSIEEFFKRALPALGRGFLALNAFIIRQAVVFAQTAQKLAQRFILSMALALVGGYPQITDAIGKMLLLAAADVVAGPAGAVIVQKLIKAMREAAAEGVTVPVTTEEQGLARIRLNPDGSVKTDRQTGTGTAGAGKGEDAETRRRIRLLELEADRAEAIARQRIAAENIAFDQRRTSLKEFTDFQVKEEEIVLEKKRAVFAAERAEAEKLGKGRELALGEIRLKELQAELQFADRRNQLLANQQREELEAAKTHRQALLEIQETADAAELARLENFAQNGDLTLFDVARRRAEIQEAAFQREEDELAKRFIEADKNKEEQGRVLDELAKLHEQHAANVEKSEREIRDSLDATVEKYRGYRNFITGVILQTREVLREVARINLADLSRTLGNQRLIIESRRKLALQEAADRNRENQLRIDDLQKSAEDEARATGQIEARKAEIEKRFNQLRAAETKRAAAERRQIEIDAQKDRERANPNSTRSLFGETFADFAQAFRTAAEQAGVAISNLQVVLGSFGAAAAEHFAAASASAGNFVSILLDGIDQIVVGLGDMLQDWILVGDVGSQALRKLLASTLAYYAKTFLIKALDNIGEGFSNLAKASAAAATGNFLSAAAFKHAAVQNFIAAAKYGIASAATAVAGRLAAGDSFKQKDTASRAVGGGDAEPRNAAFNAGQAPVESSLRAIRDGSGGILDQIATRIEALQQQNIEIQKRQHLQNAQIVEVLTKLNTARPGDVVTMGAGDAREAIGVAVLDHSNASGDFNETLQRNLGFAR